MLPPFWRPLDLSNFIHGFIRKKADVVQHHEAFDHAGKAIYTGALVEPPEKAHTRVVHSFRGGAGQGIKYLHKLHMLLANKDLTCLLAPFTGLALH